MVGYVGMFTIFVSYSWLNSLNLSTSAVKYASHIDQRGRVQFTYRPARSNSHTYQHTHRPTYPPSSFLSAPEVWRMQDQCRPGEKLFVTYLWSVISSRASRHLGWVSGLGTWVCTFYDIPTYPIPTYPHPPNPPSGSWYTGRMST